MFVYRKFNWKLRKKRLQSPGRDMELFCYNFVLYYELASCYYKMLSHSHNFISHGYEILSYCYEILSHGNEILTCGNKILSGYHKKVNPCVFIHSHPLLTHCNNFLSHIHLLLCYSHQFKSCYHKILCCSLKISVVWHTKKLFEHLYQNLVTIIDKFLTSLSVAAFV